MCIKAMSIFKSELFYYRLAQITPIAVFILMMLGSYVKAIGAGLSCPDWPLCYDQLFPETINSNYFTFEQVMAEYIHRVFASLVSILLIALLILSYIHRTDIRSDNDEIGKKRFNIMLIVLVLLLVQVIFGALTVLLKLEPFIVSVHLGVATLIFGGTIFHASWIYHPNKN
jgi:cytochrome c oxidase assembly protein subunit 15